MQQGVGSAFLYNIIIVFIIITFGFLSATLSYVKAFKVNSKIALSLEKYEGYNALSSTEITKSLSTLGYRVNEETVNCPTRKHQIGTNERVYSAVSLTNNNYKFCIYEYDKLNGYFSYGIVSYIFVDIPVVGGTFTIPVYSESEKIYEFSSK